MESQQITPINQPITYSPCMRQYLIDNVWVMVLVVVGLAWSGTCEAPQRTVLLCGVVLLSLMLIYRYAALRRLRYHIGAEQLVCEHGVFFHDTSYMELYRISDYSEQQSLLQMLLHVKTITLCSTDRSTPVLDLVGLPQEADIVNLIRQRVENNKTRRRVYEVTNR